MKLGTGKGDPKLAIDLGEYLDALYSYALVLSRNHAGAEDLVQETCLRALRAMGRLRSDSNVKSWLFTILRNIWLNQLRQAPALKAADIDLDESAANRADTVKDAYATYVSNIEREQVRNAIRQLPLDFREIILLREYEELSYEQIATLLDCAPGTVMSRLARARSRLRDLLTNASVAHPPEKERRSDSRGAVAWDQVTSG